MQNFCIYAIICEHVCIYVYIYRAGDEAARISSEHSDIELCIYKHCCWQLSRQTIADRLLYSRVPSYYTHQRMCIDRTFFFFFLFTLYSQYVYRVRERKCVSSGDIHCARGNISFQVSCSPWQQQDEEFTADGERYFFCSSVCVWGSKFCKIKI